MRIPLTTLEPAVSPRGTTAFASSRAPTRLFPGFCTLAVALVICVAADPRNVGIIVGGILAVVAFSMILFESFWVRITFVHDPKHAIFERSSLLRGLSTKTVGYDDISFRIRTFAEFDTPSGGGDFNRRDTSPECVVLIGGASYILNISRGAPVIDKHLVDFKVLISFPEMPNQPPEPTAMSVTPPAAQEPRQP